MSGFDRRITPVRDDVAAAELKGRIAAPRYADGKRHMILRGRTALREKPSPDALQDTELLFGEIFTVYDTAHGWAWGQAASDKYVGYIHTLACSEALIEPDHRITALTTPLLPAPDFKRPALDMLPMNAKVKVLERRKGFVRIAPDGFVSDRHLMPLSFRAPDWVAVAERFLGTPYVWGGKTHAGIDCSGLIQTALEAAGISIPRDTDQQEAAVGTKIAVAADPRGLKRGDIVFWNGHAGVMRDETTLLHANAFHAEVASEPFSEAVQRIQAAIGPIISVKRLAAQ